jgi:serine/alanine adding enzyme
VSLPYLNTGGVLADNEDVARAIIDRAVDLADFLKVRYLELRHEKPIEHPALTHTLTSKVHMRLPLPNTAERLWTDFDPKVRNQIRKGEKAGLAVFWGGLELLDEFYVVFARNMRDLGTPVFARRLFKSALQQFPNKAELCVVRFQERPVAAGLLVHGPGVTEGPVQVACAATMPATLTCSCTGIFCSGPSRGAKACSTSAAARLTATPSASRNSGAQDPNRPPGNTMSAKAA